MIHAVAALTVLGWLYLLLLHGGYWRARERLAADLPAPARWPSVVALVPARDEAETIGETLRSLLGQAYPGSFRVVLIDDGSRDGTAAIAHALASGADADRLSVVAGRPLPAGWTGKLWALQQGLDAVAASPPATDWLLFTDADIRHGPGQLDRLVRQAEARGCDLVSLMVRLRCENRWERLLIPAFVYFFQKLYPFAWIADPRRRTAGAAGGCVLVRRSRLDGLGGLAAIRNRLIDDCALARAVKESGGRIWLGLAEDSVSLRAYPDLDAVWQMVAALGLYAASPFAGPARRHGAGDGPALSGPAVAAVGISVARRSGRRARRRRGLGADGAFLSADARLLRRTGMGGIPAADRRRIVHRYDRRFGAGLSESRWEPVEGSRLCQGRGAPECRLSPLASGGRER